MSGRRGSRFVEISSTQVIWEWEEYGHYQQWAEPHCSQVEAHYQTFLHRHGPESVTVKSSNSQAYTLKFTRNGSNMTQENAGSHYQRNLRRREEQSNQRRVNVAYLDSLWTQYYDEEDDGMNGESIMAFCGDFSIDPASLNLLILFWKIEAKIKYYLTNTEFVMGLATLGMETRAKIGREIKVMNKYIRDYPDFKEFYGWLFEYYKDEGTTSRTLPVQVCVMLWKFVFSPPSKWAWKWIELWLEYFEAKGKHSVNRDTWKLLLGFSRDESVQTIDQLMAFDFGLSVWPSAIDDFVEFVQENEQRIRRTF